MSQRGRPREFQPDSALRRAMRLFWLNGYEGTSLTELTRVMGINKPSLYAAFGSKEALFRSAIALYDRTESDAAESLNGTQRARDSIEAFLKGNIAAYTSPGKPRGCMVVLSALIGSRENRRIRRELAKLRAADLAALQQRLDRAVSDGELPTTADTDAIARFYITVLQGLSIQARDGASRAQLEKVVEAAMETWEMLASRRPR